MSIHVAYMGIYFSVFNFCAVANHVCVCGVCVCVCGVRAHV